MHQCCVEPVRLNSATRPDWEGGDANALRRARDERWSHGVAAADIRTSHEPLHELGYRPRGLRKRQVVAADSMCNRCSDAHSHRCHARGIAESNTSDMPDGTLA